MSGRADRHHFSDSTFLFLISWGVGEGGGGGLAMLIVTTAVIQPFCLIGRGRVVNCNARKGPYTLRSLTWVVAVRCLTCQQHASVSLGRIISDSCTCCHTEIEVAYQTFCLIQSQETDTDQVVLALAP